jgi:hypothetical protein
MVRSDHAISIAGSAHLSLAKRRALFARSQTETMVESRSMVTRAGRVWLHPEAVGCQGYRAVLA